jgi:hypothetical protein
VVTRLAVGAPGLAFPLPIAPIACEPFVPPVVGTPLKLITVIEAATLRDRVALTVTFVREDGAKVRQISDVPLCVLVLTTSAQVSPAPVTLETTVLVPLIQSVATKARSSSLPEVVEKDGLVIVVLFVPRSTHVVASIEIPVLAVAVKLTPPMLTLLIVTVWFVGLNVKPAFDGVTV